MVIPHHPAPSALPQRARGPAWNRLALLMLRPLGHAVVDGKFVPVDWWSIVSGPIVRVRWPHMLLAAFLTTGMSIIATGAW